MNFYDMHFLKQGIAFLASIFLLSDFSQAAKSVSHYGITWTFLEDRPTGVFANGEPWVVGPVTIKRIDPVSNDSNPVEGTRNGSMLNPIPNTRQGFDSEPNTGIPETQYDAGKNVALKLPLQLASGDILASSITRKAYPRFIDFVCVLTVLETSPPEGSFRPGAYGKDHVVRWNKSDINYGVLKNLPKVLGAPSKAEIESVLPALPWWEWGPHQAHGILSAFENLASDSNGQLSTYGREIANKWGNVALWLNLDYSNKEKEKAMIQTIQCGIDIMSYVENGGGFYPDGGHKSGRKFPVVLAAVALNDPDLRKFASNPDTFAEDTTTFIITQSDVGRQVVAPGETYDETMIGLADWGVRHRWEPAHDDSRWEGGVPYRFVNWPANAGSVLAIDLMGQRAAWGHPAIFAYNERFYSKAGFGGFVGSMWRYKDGSGDSQPKGLRIKKR